MLQTANKELLAVDLFKCSPFRAVPNFFHLGGAISLAEVENMAALQPFTLGGSGDMLPQEILGVLRRILVHSEAYREAQRAC